MQANYTLPETRCFRGLRIGVLPLKIWSVAFDGGVTRTPIDDFLPRLEPKRKDRFMTIVMSANATWRVSSAPSHSREIFWNSVEPTALPNFYS